MDHRLGTDRRKHPRGGRRENDSRGYSPLIMVIESDDARREVAHGILAASYFAVAPVASVDGALAICRALAPSVIVCNESDESQIRGGLYPLIVPIVVINGEPIDIVPLVERIRHAIRGTPVRAI
jgi:CheY-like chemotaxis protein